MKKLGTLDKIILIIGIVWLLMIPTMIVIFLIKGAIPDTLVQCVMGSSSIELIVAAWIKTTKVKMNTYDSWMTEQMMLKWLLSSCMKAFHKYREVINYVSNG